MSATQDIMVPKLAQVQQQIDPALHFLLRRFSCADSFTDALFFDEARQTTGQAAALRCHADAGAAMPVGGDAYILMFIHSLSSTLETA
jgi:hypothetical protein